MPVTAPRKLEAESTSVPCGWDGTLGDHRDWLRSVVLARLGEPQAAEDVMQEVAVAVMNGRHRLADPTKLESWLYQIAVRQTLMYRRKHGRRRKLVDRYANREQPHESDTREPDPLEWLLAIERAELIGHALEGMHPRDREVLMLKYEHELSYREISNRLGIGMSAVEARLHRARQRLRKALARLDVVATE